MLAPEEEYDKILARGRKQNTSIRNVSFKENEARLLRRLAKYKSQHLLFMRNPDVEWTNNMSERDVRVCRKHTNVSGGFRSDRGQERYCDILSVLRTMLRQGINQFTGIQWIMAVFTSEVAS